MSPILRLNMRVIFKIFSDDKNAHHKSLLLNIVISWKEIQNSFYHEGKDV